MTDRRARWVEYLFGISGVGFICLLLGVAMELRPLMFVGLAGVALLALLLVIALLGDVWNGLDRALPKFKGKRALVAVVLLLLAAAFAVIAFSGHSDFSCPSYRGVPTCE